MTQQQLMDTLEPLVDTTSLDSVILALARVCDEKAEHIIINWQDRSLAKIWSANARRLDRASHTRLP